MLSRTLKGMTVAGAIAVLAVGGTAAATAQSPRPPGRARSA